MENSDDQKHVVAERLGFHGEISAMIEKNMTLDDATARHLKNWGLGNKISVLHEAVGHIALGLLLHTHPELMKGKPYQGSEEAEIYAGAIGDTIQVSCPRDWMHYFNDKQSFADSVISSSKFYFVIENQNRVLSWPQTKSLQVSLPDGLADLESLIPFEIPTVERAGDIYDAVLPAIQFLQEKIYEIQIELGAAVIPDKRMAELLKKITVGEVVERLIDGRIYSGLIGKGPQPEMNPTPIWHDIIRERDAALFAP